jgi:hypothetical protein
MAELTVPLMNFSALGQLGNVYKQNRNEQKLSDLGRMLADGSIDYRGAAGQVADMGDINSTLKFLALAEQEKQKKLELQAGTQFNASVGGMFGAQPPAARPAAVGVPSLSELGPTAAPPRAAVPSTPKVWGDAEAEAAGLYEAKKPAAAPATIGAPRADGPNAEHVPVLIAALSNPNLPSGQKETAKLLLGEAFKNMKEPEKIQTLRALQANPQLLEIEKQLKASTTVTVDQKGEGELSKTLGKGLGERVNDIAKEGDAARTDLAMVGQLRDLGAAVKTGGPAAVQGWLASHGIKVGDNVGAVEAYSSIVDKLTPSQRVPGSGASSDLDVKMFKNSLPKLINTPEGNEIIQNTLAGVAQYKLERAAIADRVQAGEMTAKEGIKLIRDLPNPYANFKEFAKTGFRADASNPASTGPSFNDRFSATRPGNQPIRVTSPAQARSLPSGTPIILPDGTEGRVP